jgi:hypothetical protein
MPRLTGPEAEELRDALCAAFDDDSLTQMVRFKLGEKLGDIVGSDSLRTRAFQLIEYYEQLGTVEQLLRAVYETRPRNPQVVAFGQAHPNWVPASTKAAREAAESVSQGLRALADLLQTLGALHVRERLRRFREDFRTTRDTIGVLDKYKKLHDCLHFLQFRYYQELVRTAATFLSNDADNTALDGYTMDLRQEVQKAESHAQGLPSYQTEAGWIALFRRAVTSLRQGLDSASEAPVRVALSLLNGVLAVQPSRINGLLTAKAGELRLKDLIQALRATNGDIQSTAVTNANQPLVMTFQAGLKDLTDLQPGLMGLVEEHLHWQQIDNNLRLAEANLGLSLDYLLALWPDVRDGARGVCDLGPELTWARELIDLVAKVEVVIAARNPVLLTRTFLKCRRAVMLHFYEVDCELKERCEQLVPIGTSLDVLFGVIT